MDQHLLLGGANVRSRYLWQVAGKSKAGMGRRKNDGSDRFKPQVLSDRSGTLYPL
jgi:hypothetical protein